MGHLNLKRLGAKISEALWMKNESTNAKNETKEFPFPLVLCRTLFQAAKVETLLQSMLEKYKRKAAQTE